MADWQAAAAAVSATVDCPSSSILAYPSYPPFTPDWWTAARASEAANAAVFPAARAATAHNATNGPAHPPPAPLTVDGWNHIRALANVLADSALLAHFGDHDDARCLTRLTDLFQLANTCDRQRGRYGPLVGLGIRAIAVSRLNTILPDLDVRVPNGERRRTLLGMRDDLLRDRSPDQGRMSPTLVDRATAECRAAAVAITVHLYRVDHAGRWPADLSGLIPTYLPAVPSDPLVAVTNYPIGYVVRPHALPDGGDRPLLVIGPRPANPVASPLPPEPEYSWFGKSDAVQWRDLARWTPALNAAARALP